MRSSPGCREVGWALGKTGGLKALGRVMLAELTHLSPAGTRRCVWRKVGTKGIFMGMFIDLNLSPLTQTMTTSYFLKLELHFNPK